jgi:hypothetical protein
MNLLAVAGYGLALTATTTAWALGPCSSGDDVPPAAVSSSPAPSGRFAPHDPDCALTARPPVGEPERHWYGWQVVATDGVALALSIAGGAASSDNNSNANAAFFALSGITYVLGGPIVHLAHHRAGTGFASLVLRVGLPVGGALMGGLIGEAVASGSHTDDQWGGLEHLETVAIAVAGGASVGAVAAVILDPTFLSYEERQAAPQHARGPIVTPVVSAIKDGATLGVAGVF